MARLLVILGLIIFSLSVIGEFIYQDGFKKGKASREYNHGECIFHQ